MNLNKTFYAGRLTKDLEYKTGNSNLAKGTLAINRDYESKGEKKTETAYIPFTAWGKIADVMAKNLKKGDPALIIGRMVTESWESNGEKKSKLVCVVEEFKFLGSKNKDAATSQGSGAQDHDDVSDVPADGEAPF